MCPLVVKYLRIKKIYYIDLINNNRNRLKIKNYNKIKKEMVNIELYMNQFHF